MVAAGAALAVTAGLAYNLSAAVEKHEAVQVDQSFFGLLLTLARRRWWLAAVGLGLAGWVAQVAALALAPVVVVMPLMGSGAALLVALGVRWLGERFTRAELWALVMVAGGSAAVALSAAGIDAARTKLTLFAELAVGVAGAAGAFAASRRPTGIRFGIAAGSLYGASAIYSKQVGDLIAVGGPHALRSVLTSPALWIMIGMALWALALVNAGFQRANAASVAASMTAVDSVVPILAGYILFHERAPHGWALVLLVIGLGAALGGMVVLGSAAAGREIAPSTTAVKPAERA